MRYPCVRVRHRTWGSSLNISEREMRELVAAADFDERKAKKQASRNRAKAALRQFAEDRRQADAAAMRDFEQLHGFPICKLPATGAYALKSFEGAWKVPREIVNVLLRDESLWHLRRDAQHANVAPKVLRALNADPAEEVSRSWWNRPLKDYQREPICKTLTSYGYRPSEKQTTVAHFLKLLRAGRDVGADADQPTCVGDGDSRVSFSSKKSMLFRGRTHSVQWRGDSGRVRIDGRMVGLSELLAGTGHDRKTIVMLSENAENRHRAQVAARELEDRQQEEADALFADMPMADTYRDTALSAGHTQGAGE